VAESKLITPWIFRKLSLLVLIFIFSQIAEGQGESGQKVLVRIGSKEITVQEFRERSEFTPRPVPFEDKNTTLNNLISEKLLAIEAERHGFQLNHELLANLKGIKEQKMREDLYYVEAYDKVKLDLDVVKKAYRLSQREYKVEYYTIDSKKLAHELGSIKSGLPRFSDSLFSVEERTLGRKPVHTVTFKDADDDAIHEALFTKLMDVGTVIGPLELSNGQYMIMKVVDWTDYPVIGGEDQAIRWNEVKNKLSRIQGDKLWRSYEAAVMRGKKMVFNKKAFEILSTWAMEKYLSSKDSVKFRIAEIPDKPGIDLGAPFFTLDKKVWTVKDFRTEVMSHPLVFRTTDLDATNFRLQFELAVIDLMRDHFLTMAAYRGHLDTLEDVRRTEEMWKDSFLSSYEARNVMDTALERGLISDHENLGKMKYWHSYLDSLQLVYAGSITINSDELKRVSLTHIDMVAWRPQDPYPLAVPGFPTLIPNGDMSYAQKNGK
jgi:hypothetical protein